MEETLTWEVLATVAGASAITALIVQLIKGYVPLKTDALSYIVGLAVLWSANAALGAVGWQPYGLAVFLAVLVAFSANRIAQIAGQDGR